MRYTVVWSSSAQDQLADLWLQASDRKAITELHFKSILPCETIQK
jgi:hypothetical protein